MSEGVFVLLKKLI